MTVGGLCGDIDRVAYVIDVVHHRQRCNLQAKGLEPSLLSRAGPRGAHRNPDECRGERPLESNGPEASVGGVTEHRVRPHESGKGVVQ